MTFCLPNPVRLAGAALAAGLFGTACVAPAPVGPVGPPPLPIAAAAVPVAAPALPKASTPVYRNPKIAMVYLRAHEDTAGRLLGPQIMYQVSDPGGWNVEAVDQGKAYIPAVNLEIPPGQGSPYVVAARAAPSSPAQAGLLDPDQAGQIALTGLMRREDEDQAEVRAREATPGSTAAFDPEAGWIILPPRNATPTPANASASGMEPDGK